MTTETQTNLHCPYCQRAFRRASSLEIHVCEQKRRRQEQDTPAVRLAFHAFLEFFRVLQGSARLKSREDFMTSPYYRAFVKWAHYCVNTRAIEPERFLAWLLTNNHRIDAWASDSKYEQYLMQHVRQEPAESALARAVESALDWNERTGNLDRDYLRYGNHNMLCHAITTGRVTAWVLYNCESGQALLAALSPEHLAMVWPWIDSEYWGQRFGLYPADRAWAQEILQRQGW